MQLVSVDVKYPLRTYKHLLEKSHFDKNQSAVSLLNDIAHFQMYIQEMFMKNNKVLQHLFFSLTYITIGQLENQSAISEAVC